MGQQQLLIVLLVVIIIGIATIIGIQLFNKEALSLEEDEYERMMIEIAENAHAWSMKPVALGGGGGPDWASLNFNKIPCPVGNANSNNPANCDSADRNVSFQMYHSGTTLSLWCYVNYGADKYNAVLYVYEDGHMFWSKHFAKV